MLFRYPIKLNISRNEVNENSTKKFYIAILTDLPNAIDKMLDKISFHKHKNYFLNHVFTAPQRHEFFHRKMV